MFGNSECFEAKIKSVSISNQFENEEIGGLI